MTDRLLRALECPHLRILGHPTGRMLLHRDPYPFDFDRVAAEAVRRGVWLEINASPERLDLHGTLIRTATGQGCEVHHLHRRASSQTPRQHALRRRHRAPRMAGAQRHFEYARRRRVRRAPSKPNHENHQLEAGIRLRSLPRHRRRGGRPQDEIPDQAQRGAAHRQRRDDGGR